MDGTHVGIGGLGARPLVWGAQWEVAGRRVVVWGSSGIGFRAARSVELYGRWLSGMQSAEIHHVLRSYLRFAVAELHARLTRQCVVGLAQCTGHNGVSAKHHRVVVSIASHLSPASPKSENNKGSPIFKLRLSKEMQVQSHVPPH